MLLVDFNAVTVADMFVNVGRQRLPQSIHQPNNQTVAGDPLVRSYQVFSRPDTPLRNIRL